MEEVNYNAIFKGVCLNTSSFWKHKHQKKNFINHGKENQI